MKEHYPTNQKFIKTMFFIVCFICMIQFFVIAWMAGRMEFTEIRVFELHKKVLKIENALRLESTRGGE